MILEVVIVDGLVNEARKSRPIVLRQWCRERDVEGEVRELTLDSAEVLLVEDLTA